MNVRFVLKRMSYIAYCIKCKHFGYTFSIVIISITNMSADKDTAAGMILATRLIVPPASNR